MFVVYKFVKVFTLLINFLMPLEPENISNETQDEKEEVACVQLKQIISEQEFISIANARRAAIKELFIKREPINELKIKIVKKRFLGFHVFDSDKHEPIGESKVHVGQLVAIKDKESDEFIYAKIKKIRDYKPRNKIIKIYDLNAGYNQDGEVIEKSVFAKDIYKILK